MPKKVSKKKSNFNLAKRISLLVAILVLIVSLGLGLASEINSSKALIS